MKRKYFVLIGLIAAVIFVMTACDDDTIPHPRGYFRIVFPEKSYTKFSGPCPYSFEYPVYSKVVPHIGYNTGYCWVDVVFPNYNAEINISYMPVGDTNLSSILHDARGLAKKHQLMADAINEEFILYPDRRVFGAWYDMKGNTATSMQFYLTDSVKHFFRGVLYFNQKPNNDSLQPVVDFLREDIKHMIESFRWSSEEQASQYEK